MLQFDNSALMVPELVLKFGNALILDNFIYHGQCLLIGH
jgi:hypothetical protein